MLILCPLEKQRTLFFVRGFCYFCIIQLNVVLPRNINYFCIIFWYAISISVNKLYSIVIIQKLLYNIYVNVQIS